MDNYTHMLTISTWIHAEDYNDRMEAQYPCRLTCEDGVYRLKYHDEENGFTVFKLSPDGEIQIRRSSSVTIIMRQGYSHSVDYQTPYGSIPMTFTLQSADSTLTQAGGRIAYVSQVHINGEPQINRVVMELTPSERT